MAGETAAGAPIAPAASNNSSASKQPPAATPQGAHQPAPGSAQQAPMTASERRRLKLADGSEREFTIDELTSLAQKGFGSDERFRQAAAKERRLFSVLEEAKRGNTGPLVKLIGKEAATRFAESHLGEVIDWNKKSPEEQAAIREKQRADELEARLKEREEAEAARARQAEVHREAKALDRELKAAFDQLGQPVNPYLIKWACEQMEASLPDDDEEIGEDEEIEPISAHDALSSALRRFGRDVTNIFPKLSEQQRLEIMPKLIAAVMDIEPAKLRAVLPKEFLDALRRLNLKDAEDQDPLRSGRANPEASATRRDPTSLEMGRARTKTRKVAATTDEWFNQIEEKLKTRRRG